MTGAGEHEKTGDRLVKRDGYRDRDWETRAGTVERQKINAGLRQGRGIKG